jgi:hypothetical protein
MKDHESEWNRFLIDYALERAIDHIAAIRHSLFTVDTMLAAFVAEERARDRHPLSQGWMHGTRPLWHRAQSAQRQHANDTRSE